MTPEQELMWNILRWDAKTMAIQTGKILKDNSKNKKKLHKQVDYYLNYVMDYAANEIEIIKIVHYWLNDYKIPIDQKELDRYTCWDRFHSRCSQTIMNCIDNRISLKFE